MLWMLSKQRLSRQVDRPPQPLGLLIAAARRSLKEAAIRGLGRRRLSPQQFWLLVALREEPGPSLRELAQRRLMDSPTASRMVGRLVRRGLVKVEEDPRDRRLCPVRLTPAGAALARQLHPLARRLRAAVEVGLDPAEVEVLRGLLRRVIANLGRFAERGRGAPARRPVRRRTR
jgi:DNA-binding MarR family transcriptional regulator